jgi:UDP-2,3-diacylglucosamine hydrolase
MKKIYFASDFHLGIPALLPSIEREKKIVRWLNSIADSAEEIFLVGDIFDFWFDYQKAVPKGFIRLLGTLAQLSDAGIPIHLFKGNHDLWMKDYFSNELGVFVHTNPIFREWDDKKFLIGHGDGLGPGDLGYKWMKKIFTNPIAQKLFNWLHPDIGITLAHHLSGTSRNAQSKKKDDFLGAEKEWLIHYCEKKLTQKEIDYFIFGHRHLPIYYQLSNKKSVYINLGEWMNQCTYAEFDGIHLKIQAFENKKPEIITNV